MIIRPYHVTIRPNLVDCFSNSGARRDATTEPRLCAVALARLAHLRLRWLRDAHVGAGHTSHLGDRVVRLIDRRMCLADGFLVRAGHEAECLPFLQIHECGMTEHAEVLRSLLERRELVEELLFGEFLRRETAFVFVVRVDEVLHADSPSSW